MAVSDLFMILFLFVLLLPQVKQNRFECLSVFQIGALRTWCRRLVTGFILRQLSMALFGISLTGCFPGPAHQQVTVEYVS